jgi:hypothetical protein
MSTQKLNSSKPSASSNTVTFLFNKENYFIIGAGVLLLIIGYILMSGGEQAPSQFKTEEVYSFRRITLAPIIVVLGYIVIGFGIMRKPKD